MSNVANDPKSKMDDDLREMLKGIKHHELGLPWDQPVPESRWQEVAEYCDDDVIATEAGFYYLKSDWTARQILADLAGMSVNDTTNTLTTKFIFGNNKNPQNEFHYRNLAEPVLDLDEDTYQFLAEACPEMMSQTHGEAGSLLPYFPGYRYENGVSIYRGEEVGEGGYVYAEPGTYGNVALLDIACDTTVSANEGERVTVLVKNHTATINGNLSSPSARTGDVEVVREQVLEVQRVVADKATIKDLEAERARIEELVADNAVIKGRVSASEADIGELKTNNAKITGRLDANEASIKKLDAEKLTAKDAELKYATVEKLQATDAKVGNLETDNVSVKGRLNAAEGNIKNLNADNVAINKHLSANDADIKSLRAEKLNAKDADIKYANIDFSNIGIAAMEKFYSESGLIKNVVVGDQTITGELVGVTIRGDLIEGNTIKADKLVIKGEDGLYYKLNTNGSTITSEQTDYNSLNGTLIQAKSITADKVAVTDLVAFGADIAGNHIGNGAIYSGVKTSALNTTKGFYLGSDGQVGISNLVYTELSDDNSE